jgi:hypothetical protein
MYDDIKTLGWFRGQIHIMIKAKPAISIAEVIGKENSENANMPGSSGIPIT